MILEFTLVKQIEVEDPDYFLYEVVQTYLTNMRYVEGYLTEEVFKDWLSKEGKILTVLKDNGLIECINMTKKALDILKQAREILAKVNDQLDKNDNEFTVDLLP